MARQPLVLQHDRSRIILPSSLANALTRAVNSVLDPSRRRGKPTTIVVTPVLLTLETRDFVARPAAAIARQRSRPQNVFPVVRA